MRIQKRYIYSSILASLFFILFYVFINLHLIVSILVTILIFGAGILIFKEKDVRVYDPNKEFEYCYKTSKLLNYSNYVDNKKIKELIKSISLISEEMLNLIEKNRSRTTDIYNFYDYYLDLAIDIVTKYMSVRDKDKEYTSKVDDYLINIDDAFKKQLNSLKKNETLDLEKEISIFEKKNKISDNNKEGSDDNEKGR